MFASMLCTPVANLHRFLLRLCLWLRNLLLAKLGRKQIPLLWTGMCSYVRCSIATRNTKGVVERFQSSVEKERRENGHLESQNVKFCSNKKVGGIPAATALVNADLRRIYTRIRERLSALLFDNDWTHWREQGWRSGKPTNRDSEQTSPFPGCEMLSLGSTHENRCLFRLTSPSS